MKVISVHTRQTNYYSDKGHRAVSVWMEGDTIEAHAYVNANAAANDLGTICNIGKKAKRWATIERFIQQHFAE